MTGNYMERDSYTLEKCVVSCCILSVKHKLNFDLALNVFVLQ